MQRFEYIFKLDTFSSTLKFSIHFIVDLTFHVMYHLSLGPAIHLHEEGYRGRR